MNLSKPLAEVLGQVMSVEVTDDGALTVRHDGTLASLRTVTIADGLEMVSLTQAIAWDLRADAALRKRVAAQSQKTLLGTVALVEHPGKLADVVLRYNFPVSGLSDSALRTLVLMTLDAGTQVRAALIA